MFILGPSYKLSAQKNCSGVWGPPLVNVTFGAGPNPGPELHTTTSVYSYVTNDCPTDGTYTVRNNSTSCFYNDWHTVKQDHTGDAQGYFLLINASFKSNDFYLDTLKNLCSTTTYELAAWILNMTTPTSCGNGGVKPDITFRVEKLDGTIVETFNTNNIDATAEPIWKKYAFTFSTFETAIVIRMTNTNIGGCGGDFAIDDITLKPCIPARETTAIPLPEKMVAYHCNQQDTSFTFSNNFNNIYNEINFLWEKSDDWGITWVTIPGAVTPVLNPHFIATNEENLELFRLSVGEKINMGFPNCLTRAEIDSVKTVAPPVSIISSNSPVCENSNLVLNAVGDDSFLWSGPQNFSGTGKEVSLQNAQKINAGKYFINTTAHTGCTSNDSLLVTINESPHAHAGPETNNCEGTPVSLTGSGGLTYLWTHGNNIIDGKTPALTVTPSDTTTYKVTVSNQFYCSDSAFTQINVWKKSIVNAGPDKKLALGSSVKLDGSVSGTDIRYFWTPELDIDNANTIDPVVSPKTNTIYTLTGISDHGCGTNQDKVSVEVLAIDIPNVFSPNNDGINDTWNIKNLQVYSDAEISVYNRNGQKVFASHGYGKPWDGLYNGSSLPIGTYYYVILKSGNTPLQGSVTLLR